MKKSFLLALSAAMLVAIAFSGFAGGQGEAAPGQPAAKAPVVLKGGHVGSPNWQFNTALLKWAELVKERTKGAVVIEVYPSEQLGNERDLLEKTNLGAIDWCFIGAGGASSFAPPFGIFENAFTFKSLKHFENVAFNRPFRDKLAKLLEEKSSMTFLGLSWNGNRSVLSNKPIRTPEDAKGLRLRVPDVPTFKVVAYAVGATATPIPFGEAYMALKQGVADAIEGSPENMINMKFVEVAKNYTLTEHMMQGTAHLMNKDVFYKKLTPEQQEILISSAFEVMHEVFRNSEKVQAEFLKKMETEAGVNIIRLTPAERDRFRERAFEVLTAQYIPQWGTVWQDFLALAD